jgi:hypothetical protein
MLKRAAMRDRSSPAEPLPKGLLKLAGIGAPLRSPHASAHQEAHESLLASSKSLRFIGMLCDHLAHQRHNIHRVTAV